MKFFGINKKADPLFWARFNVKCVAESKEDWS